MSVVERYHFDESLFERLRALVADGTLSEESNYVRGRIEPLPSEALSHWIVHWCTRARRRSTAGKWPRRC